MDLRIELNCYHPTGEPSNDPNTQSDPFKTLFVGRIVSIGDCVVEVCVYAHVSHKVNLR